MSANIWKNLIGASDMLHTHTVLSPGCFLSVVFRTPSELPGFIPNLFSRMFIMSVRAAM